MSKPVKPIPDGYHSVTPYLSLKNAAAAIAFYKAAFNAEEIYRLDMQGNMVGHCELQIGNSRIMVADEFPDMPDAVTASPITLGNTTFGLCIYLPDVDAAFDKAIAAGAKVRRPVADQFYGDRTGTLEDPSGHIWTLATHIEDVTPAQMKERMAAMGMV